MDFWVVNPPSLWYWISPYVQLKKSTNIFHLGFHTLGPSGLTPSRQCFSATISAFAKEISGMPLVMPLAFGTGCTLLNCEAIVGRVALPGMRENMWKGPDTMGWNFLATSEGQRADQGTCFFAKTDPGVEDFGGCLGTWDHAVPATGFTPSFSICMEPLNRLWIEYPPETLRAFPFQTADLGHLRFIYRDWCHRNEAMSEGVAPNWLAPRKGFWKQCERRMCAPQLAETWQNGTCWMNC